MKKIIGIFGLLSLLIVMSFGLLEFYSSMTKVETDGDKLKFSTKLSTSNVSEVLKIDPKTAGFEAEVKKYVNSKVSVSINGSPQSLTFIGSQLNGDVVWIYYEVRNIPEIHTLKIRNSALMEAYPKQLNLINISYKGIQKNMNLSKGSETSEVTF